MEIIFLLIAIFLIIVVLIANKFIDNTNPFPFSKKQSIYSTAERSFFQLLEKSVGNDYKIIARVKLMDIIETKQTATSKNRRAALMKAGAKTVDFVLCDRETLSICAVVDLINNANKDGHRAKSDWFVTGALEAAGIPHIRIKIKAGYKAEEIRQCINFKLGKKSPTVTKPPLVRGTIGKTRSPLAGLPTGLSTARSAA